MNILKPTIPVCLPKLPTAEKIFPYLQQIDTNRWYSNYGPLSQTFLSRLAQLFQIKREEICCAANGTLLIELCLKSMGIAPGSLCITPSWTFVATPLAIQGAKLQPLFVDVDVKTQALDPIKLEQDLPFLSKQGKIGAVIVVLPFGMPIDTAAWDQFVENTGIPVLIDAAAGFDSVLQLPQISPGRIPIMISLHATKVLGIGEGSILLSTDNDLIARIEAMTQFGFTPGVRDAKQLGTNAKISEYTAAVGLAALDEWLETRAAWHSISHHYQHLLADIGVDHLLSDDWVPSTCNVILPYQADLIAHELNKMGIMVRKWWGEGCHAQTVFHQALRGDLSNTEYLQQSVLGLPFYMGMELATIDIIVNRLAGLMRLNSAVKIFA